ncbi:MAG TPA: hypothetical protein DCM86_09510, partial [Verrucomicrobiales bacterium]|nr:hypothetical protein [Verrucomicrobiales bacterium]
MRTFPPRGWIEPSGVGRARWLALLLLVLLPAVARSLDWTAPVEGVRSAPLPVTMSGGGPGFTLLDPSRTRIEFSNRLGIDRSVTNQILLNGSGVAAGDIDGDGWCDLYFCAIDGSNALFRNLGGWRFEEITERAGVACRDLQSTGAVLADLDGDGDLDLLVNTVGHGTRIFLNDGRGHFTPGATLNEGRAGMSMALGDLDGDGNLDLYIANYRVTTLRDMPHTGFKLRKIEGGGLAVAFVNGRPVSDPDLEGRFVIAPGGRIVERGEVDAVYRGDGHGGFTPVPFLGGRFLDEEGHPLTEAPHDWGLSVVMRDLNQDGAPDLYVCNDFDSVDRFWLNDGKGGFRAAPRLALRSTSRFSMGVDVADINRDGWDDLLVLDMLSPDHVTRLTRGDGAWFDPAGGGRIDSRPQVPRNTLQLARGDGTYAEISQYAGLDATGWSWTPMFLDVDLDGYEDLLVTAGHARDDTDLDTAARIERMKRAGGLTPSQELELRRASPRLELPRMAFRNLGNLRFAAMSAAWHFDQVGVGHGMCAADLDNDGDLDVVVNNLNAPAGIYRNEAAAARVAVRLRGLGGNTRGIGARITLRQGAVPIQSQELQAGGRYLSGDDSMRVFAASGAGGPMALEVRWRSGRVSRVEGVLA